MTKHNLTVFFILLLLSLVIIFFGQNQIILLFKHYLSETLRPFEVVFSKASNWLFFWQNAIFNIKNIKESNTHLILENLDLYNKLAKLPLLEEENSLLREKLNLSQKAIDTRLAGIIGRDFQNNRSLLIDKGTNDGLAIGMVVISEGETIIGRIADISYNTSKVQTTLDTQSRIAAITATSKISGLVRGLGSDVILDLIVKNKKPEVGELIVSSGTDGIWPRGFIIGKVKEVKSQDNQVFNTANIELLAKPQDFDSVFVILNSQ
ncbi:MAG: rod shape-determining protein MreC [Candidatus Azambacteria bacterium]|nr:rod shape-determining protein MreC [Candidatus Azambacteria bacterium]